MPKTVRQICIDHVVSPQLEDAAYETAVAEFYLNRSPFEGAGLYTTRWQIGRVLHIAFLGGDAKIQEKVVYSARQWCNYANINFLFDNDAKAEIRIAFESEGKGSWSEVGTNALCLPFNAPTMNFDLSLILTDEEFSATVLHEFGHMLGMIHEHQSPTSGILWNKPAVIQFFSDPPNNWDQETIEANIFKRYTTSQTQYSTPFDPYSIMVYPILPEWTLDDFEVQMNMAISQRDKQFIMDWYPYTT